MDALPWFWRACAPSGPGCRSAGHQRCPARGLSRQDGLQVPGLPGWLQNSAVRAILGQQITVKAARTLGTRLVERLSEPLAEPVVA